MWLRRRFLPVAGCLLLAACGFQPLYGTRPDGAPVEALRAVEVAIIPDRQGQILRNQLQLLFNPTGAPAPDAYRLAVALTTSGADALIRKDETASRLDLVVTAEFTLTSLPDGRVLHRGRARSVNSFDVVESDFATINAERDALEASLRQIAHTIQTQLAIYFERRSRGLAVASRAGAEPPR